MSQARSQLRLDFEAYVRVSALPTVIVLAYMLWHTPWIFPPLPPGTSLNFKLDLAVSSFLFPIVIAGWFTYCRSGAKPAWLPSNWRTVFRTYLAILIYLVVLVAPTLVVVLPFWAYHGFPAHFKIPPPWELAVIPLVVWGFVAAISFLPLVPEAASGGRMNLRETWQRTRGFRWLIVLKVFLFAVAGIVAVFVLIMPVKYPALTRGWYAWPILTWHFAVGWAFDFYMLWGLNRIMMRLPAASDRSDFELNAIADARQGQAIHKVDLRDI